MNAEVSRRAARALQNSALTPQQRLRIANVVEPADSWAGLPADVRLELEAAEKSTATQAEVGEQLLRRSAADDVADRLR